MKLKIGNNEAIQLRARIAGIDLTKKQIAEHLGITDRYLREILSVDKQKSIGVDQEKIEELLALLGISLSHIYSDEDTNTHNKSAVLEREGHIKKLRSWMYQLLSNDASDPYHNQQLAQFLHEDRVVNKTMGFWYTLIVKTIADKYQTMRFFFNENDFFNIIPDQGYWRKFRHNTHEQKNCYFSFKLIPSRPDSCFKLAYTLESPVAIKSLTPRKIKIFFGKLEFKHDHILVTQFHTMPGSYKVKAMDEMIVTLWLDEANHDFLIFCDHEFTLTTVSHPQDHYRLGVKTKREVQTQFHALETALFPRNSMFHRLGRRDMGDDPLFFWNNQNFLEFNAELFDELLNEPTLPYKEGE